VVYAAVSKQGRRRSTSKVGTTLRLFLSQQLPWESVASMTAISRATHSLSSVEAGPFHSANSLASLACPVSLDVDCYTYSNSRPLIPFGADTCFQILHAGRSLDCLPESF
jgi:hypothetical protein